MDVTISSTALAAILAEAAASPNREICGLLMGKGCHVRAARSCRNIAVDPARRFEIDPVALLAAYRQARSGGEQVLGHYHSHPSGLAVPSARDAADAVADSRLWLIVAGDEVRLWRAVPDGPVEGRFAPVGFESPPPCAGSSPPPEERNS